MPRPKKVADTEEDNDEPTEPTDNPPQHPMSAGVTIKGQSVTGKGETRLYQTSPDVKEYLTKEQAHNHGFYWAEEPKTKGKA